MSEVFLPKSLPDDPFSREVLAIAYEFQTPAVDAELVEGVADDVFKKSGHWRKGPSRSFRMANEFISDLQTQSDGHANALKAAVYLLIKDAHIAKQGGVRFLSRFRTADKRALLHAAANCEADKIRPRYDELLLKVTYRPDLLTEQEIEEFEILSSKMRELSSVRNKLVKRNSSLEREY